MDCCTKAETSETVESASTEPSAQAAAPGDDTKNTVDLLVFHFGAELELQLLTITKTEPWGDLAMLPGRELVAGEATDVVAARVMTEATEHGSVTVMKVGTFQRPVPGADISHAFFAFAPDRFCKVDGLADGLAGFTQVVPLASARWAYRAAGVQGAGVVAAALAKASDLAQAGHLKMFLPPEAAAAFESLQEELQKSLDGFRTAGVLPADALVSERPACPFNVH